MTEKEINKINENNEINDERLTIARQMINEADGEMAKWFLKRMEAVQLVAAYKQDHGLPIPDEKREEEVIRRNTEKLGDSVMRTYYASFIRNTMAVSRAYQRVLTQGMRVAFSGVKGAYAHEAAHRLFESAEKIPCESFKEAYDSVVTGKNDAAVLPLENSFAGEVGQVTDLIYGGSLYMNGVYDLEISHVLAAPAGAKKEEIDTVVSHAQALGQCASFIRNHNLHQVEYENTALAAKYVSEEKNPHWAAICSRESAKLYGLEIFRENIADSGSNTTRFAVFSRAEDMTICQKDGAHFALMLTVRNEAGALARALNTIGAYEFNMRTLRSRPMKELLWQYYFYVECKGNIHTREGENMLEELALCCEKVQYVGSFVPARVPKEQEK